MTNLHHLIILGTRPEIIKVSQFIRLLKEKNEVFTIIDTGQHYDYEMSKIFYEELNLPEPEIILEIPKDNPNAQIGFILTSLLNIIPTKNPSVIYAQGDTNTVLAAALSAQRLLIPFAHIEAGIRSYDMTMPEEVNRRIASICASFHFCPTDLAAKNLLMEGVDPNKIFVTGNTIVDTVKYFLNNKELFKNKLKTIKDIIPKKDFFVLTLHRPGTVDNKEILTKVLIALTKINHPVLFLIHPRTRNRIKSFTLQYLVDNSNIILEKPLGYFEFLFIMDQSFGIITDSGGIQEEATTINKRCIILRPNTERPEAVVSGFNSLINPFDKNFEEKFLKAVKTIEEVTFDTNKGIINPFGNGDTSERMYKIIKNAFDKKSLVIEPPDFTAGFQNYLLKEINNENDIPAESKIQMIFNEKGEILIEKPDQIGGKKVILKNIEKYV